MKEIIAYLSACNRRWEENIGYSFLHYVAEIVLAYRAAGYTPEDAADQLQLQAQHAYPKPQTKKE